MAMRMKKRMRSAMCILVAMIAACSLMQVTAYASETGSGEEDNGGIIRHEDSTSMPLPETYYVTAQAQNGGLALANVPQTGDMSLLWAALSGISGAGLLMLNRKCEE